MTNSKSTKKALLTSSISLLLCFAMLLGTTFAWFTDSAVSGNNIIKAGNLDMQLSYKPYGAENTEWKEVKEDTVLFGKDALYEPGYTEAVWLKVENLGSLAFRYDLAINVANEKQGTNKAGEKFSLSDYLEVKYLNATSTNMESDFYTTRESLDSFNWGGAANSGIASLSNNIAVIKNGTAFAKDDATMGAYNSSYVLVVISMPTTVGNEANHDGKDIPEIKFTLSAVATQLTYEDDSFGNQYDADAPATPVSTAQGLKDAMLERGANIVLRDDIVIDASTPLQWGKYMFVANGREVTIDLNGHSIIVNEDAQLKTNAVFTTANGGTLNIVGDGTVKVKNGKSGIFHAMNKDDQINVYGGTYVSNSDNGSDALAIMYTNRGNIDVYGGVFRPLAGIPCANAEDRQGNRISIVFHEGVLFETDNIQRGDSTRIKLADGCTKYAVEIDGNTWYKIVKA